MSTEPKIEPSFTFSREDLADFLYHVRRCQQMGEPGAYETVDEWLADRGAARTAKWKEWRREGRK